MIELIVFSLATWRISSLFTKEAGPGKMFECIRSLFGIKHDQDGRVYLVPSGFFADLLSCVWCTSIWVATFWLVFWIFFPDIAFYSACVFAFSALAIFMDRRLA